MKLNIRRQSSLKMMSLRLTWARSIQWTGKCRCVSFIKCNMKIDGGRFEMDLVSAKHLSFFNWSTWGRSDIILRLL